MPSDERGEVVLELSTNVGWQRLGSQSPAEPPGSFSSYEPQGRQVYVFGWLPTGDGPGVWRSAGGFDVETEAFRDIIASGFEPVADLTIGPCELAVHRADRSTATVRLRWST